MDNNFDFNTLNEQNDNGDALHITTDIPADAFAGKAKKAKDVVPEVDLAPLAPLAPTHDENKGFMRFMPPLIKEMNRRGVPFTLNGNTGTIDLGGFYRGAGLTLEVGEGDELTVIDKRVSTSVASFDDLVALNFKWWAQSNARENVNPDRPWLDEFLSKSLVKRQTIYVAIDQAGE